MGKGDGFWIDINNGEEWWEGRGDWKWMDVLGDCLYKMVVGLLNDG